MESSWKDPLSMDEPPSIGNVEESSGEVAEAKKVRDEKEVPKNLRLDDFPACTPIEKVFIPQMNGYVYIRLPTGDDAVDLGLAKSADDSVEGSANEVSKKSMFAVMASCIRDERGEKIFDTPEAVIKLRQQSAGIFKIMSAVINENSDVGGEVEKSVKD